MRKRIFDIIEPRSEETIISITYDIVMIVAICLSLVPLLFKQQTPTLIIIDKVTVTIFIVDYILRLITADYKFDDKSVKSFIKYPFTFMALVDLFSILPSLTVLNNGFKAFRILRLLRAFKVIKAFKIFRYSESVEIIVNVFQKQKASFITVFWFAVGYIILAAIVIFQFEPETFDTFFDAIYWATISLTTVGYGDIFAVTTIGKIITMISSLVGIAIIALPSGIITAGYIRELENRKRKEE